MEITDNHSLQLETFPNSNKRIDHYWGSMVSQKEKHLKPLKKMYFAHLYFFLFRVLSSLFVIIQNNLILCFLHWRTGIFHYNRCETVIQTTANWKFISRHYITLKNLSYWFSLFFFCPLLLLSWSIKSKYFMNVTVHIF